jgi:uncharacterized OsmC-like protein
MSTKKINLRGYATKDSEFSLKTPVLKIRINDRTTAEVANPLEGVLVDFANSVHQIGEVVAKELGIELKSVAIEVLATLIDVKDVTRAGRSGFKSIEIIVKPDSDAPLLLLKEWIDSVKLRCPVRDTLLRTIPVGMTLIKEYSQTESTFGKQLKE